MAKIILTMLVFSAIVLSIGLSASYVGTRDVIHLQILQNQLTSLVETLFEQNCAPGMTVSGMDSQGHVVCEETSSWFILCNPPTAQTDNYRKTIRVHCKARISLFGWNVVPTMSGMDGIGFAHLPHFGKMISASNSTSPMCLSHLLHRITRVS